MVLADLKPAAKASKSEVSLPGRGTFARPALGCLPIQLLECGVDGLAAQVQIGGQLATDNGDKPPNLRQFGAGSLHLAACLGTSRRVVEDDVATGDAARFHFQGYGVAALRRRR